MKPTKEQLADPKWWDENAPRESYFVIKDKVADGAGYISSQRGFYPSETLKPIEYFKKSNEWSVFKRPEPEWVPEVGVECLWFSPNANCWTHTKVIAYNDSMTSAWLEGEGVVTVNSSYSQFRPIKTQREELIDIVHQRGLAKNKAGAAADAILTRFDLTGKEG